MAQLAFGTPLNLGFGVNTGDNEEGPAISADGLSLLFRHYQGTPPEATEILEATRISTSEPFGNVVSAGAAINAGGFPGHPEVSDDGLTLLFKKDEDGIAGLYQATRANRSQPFGTVTSLGDLLPGQREESPSISADGLTLYFTAWDTTNVQNDIYQATRSSVSDTWENVVMLSSAINVPGHNDAMPSISNDGLMLFFNSTRPGGFGGHDLYVSTRASSIAPWGNAVNLGPQVNTTDDDKGPEISADGNMLYFHSKRVGGAGLEDLYQVEIVDLPPTKFYVVNDGSTDSTYEYGAFGTAIENYSIQNTNTAPRGAASNVAADKVWVVDANKKVYVYNASGGLLGSWTLGSLASNATVEGITTNGTDIWIVDSKSDKVFKYTGAASRLSGSQNAASSFSLNRSNTSPTDLVTDGSSIWVLNNTSLTDKVFKYSASGSLLGSWTITSGGGSPTGLTIDPTNVNNIWIVDNNRDRVYQFDSAASQTSGSASPSSSFALAAGNTNPQGIADPPPPELTPVCQPTITAFETSTPNVETSSRKIVSSDNDAFAQIDTIFENWDDDGLLRKSLKRLVGRR